jgi:hypothetical protein
MSGLPLGLLVETLVAVLLATTIGYCVILNQRLKRLHADRDQLRRMVADLVQATTLANAAVAELKTAALEADTQLRYRVEEAGRLGVELASHLTAGRQVMEKLARIMGAARSAAPEEEPQPVANKAHSALQQLVRHARVRGDAA